MSIASRIQDAVMLWENGRTEGAFLLVLIAVAASSRRRYPDRKTIKDREAFERFLTEAMSARLHVEYRGDCHSVEHIFYKWLRCELVHEGGLPLDIEFMSPDDGLSLRAGGAPEYVLKVSRGWFHHLVRAVMTAPENREFFPANGS